MRRAIITVGLGFGDEGKGSWCDYLVRKYKAEVVIRYSGGSQCGHNVELPNGTRHTFSQMGAGTFAGATTYLGPQVIINPYTLKPEQEALEKAGITNVASKLLVHPKCLVSTVYHQWMNRLKELARSPSPNSWDRHGSCGHGIGETRSYWLKYGSDAIFAEDLNSPRVLEAKLELIRQRSIAKLATFSHKLSPEIQELYNLPALACRYAATVLGRLALSHLTLSWEPPPFKTAVFEGAQGMLLDENYGFHPHTTWSTVGPHHALELVDGLADECCVLGLTRSYTTRHGPGPLPTFSQGLTEQLRDPGNPDNPWQGRMKCGYLDIPLLKYAIDCCHGNISGLLLSHLDQVNDEWFVCTEHRDEGETVELTAPFYPLSMRKRELLGRKLELSKAVTKKVTATELQRMLNNIIPVIGTANGPTHEHREIMELPFIDLEFTGAK